jgi:hypothetical protein
VLSDRERRWLEDIERGLLDHDPTWSRRFGVGQAVASSRDGSDLTAEGYAVLALISGLFAVFFVSYWPVLSGLLLVTAVVSWRIGGGARPLFGRSRGATSPH